MSRAAPRAGGGGNVYLSGFMAVGKSTVGRLLAARLQLPFCDLDREVEARAGLDVPEIFASVGEAGFRALERRALEQSADRRPEVVAVGGGALVDPAARAVARAAGHILTLTASLSTLRARALGGGGRPLFEDSHALLARRAPAYADSDALIDTEGLAPEQVVDRLCEALHRLRLAP